MTSFSFFFVNFSASATCIFPSLFSFSLFGKSFFPLFHCFNSRPSFPFIFPFHFHCFLFPLSLHPCISSLFYFPVFSLREESSLHSSSISLILLPLFFPFFLYLFFPALFYFPCSLHSSSILSFLLYFTSYVLMITSPLYSDLSLFLPMTRPEGNV
jgi:hypothetical protein